ncbi:MAG TPA: hypothetical protein VES88_11405 [Gemmatimonadaceae bacterium]|nr:hypothetical protein [Gemmatimonadaceae bacterium]
MATKKPNATKARPSGDVTSNRSRDIFERNLAELERKEREWIREIAEKNREQLLTHSNGHFR